MPAHASHSPCARGNPTLRCRTTASPPALFVESCEPLPRYPCAFLAETMADCWNCSVPAPVMCEVRDATVVDKGE